MYRQAGTTPNFTDIARRYGLSESKVKSSLSRSRQALGEQLRKEGYDV